MNWRDENHYLQLQEVKRNLREYVEVMASEPDGIIPLSKIYHDLRRILGDEE